MSGRASRDGTVTWRRRILLGAWLLAALGPSVDRPQVLPDLVEPLSEREGEVLRRLQSEMTGPQIARELGMSVHTFRSHTKNLYAKLGVHGRRQAVRRGRELDLI